MEEYYKALKQYVSLNKSSRKAVRTQSNHIFASIYSYLMLEYLSMKSELNPTVFRTKLSLIANRAAFNQLENLKISFAMKF